MDLVVYTRQSSHLASERSEPDNLSSYNDIKSNRRESIGGNTDFAIGKTTYRCVKGLEMIKTLSCVIWSVYDRS